MVCAGMRERFACPTARRQQADGRRQEADGRDHRARCLLMQEGGLILVDDIRHKPVRKFLECAAGPMLFRSVPTFRS